MQPVGTKSAASFSENFGGAFLQMIDRGILAVAVVAETSASAMARRMAGVGFVTVSLRRSTGVMSVFHSVTSGLAERAI